MQLKVTVSENLRRRVAGERDKWVCRCEEGFGGRNRRVLREFGRHGDVQKRHYFSVMCKWIMKERNPILTAS